jgi:hypothetical protein
MNVFKFGGDVRRGAVGVAVLAAAYITAPPARADDLAEVRAAVEMEGKVFDNHDAKLAAMPPANLSACGNRMCSMYCRNGTGFG